MDLTLRSPLPDIWFGTLYTTGGYIPHIPPSLDRHLELCLQTVMCPWTQPITFPSREARLKETSRPPRSSLVGLPLEKWCTGQSDRLHLPPPCNWHFHRETLGIWLRGKMNLISGISIVTSHQQSHMGKAFVCLAMTVGGECFLPQCWRLDFGKNILFIQSLTWDLLSGSRDFSRC